MQIELRDYTIDGRDDILDALRKWRRLVYVLPTGGGKTVIAALVAQKLNRQGRRVLYLVHRRELIDQASATMHDALPRAEIGEISPRAKPTPDAPIQVASVQTLVRRTDVKAPDVIFIDEAHHVRANQWESIIARWPKARLVGLTATPARLDGKGLGKHFDKMIEGPTIPELVEASYLAPVDTLVPPMETVLQWRQNKNAITVADAVHAYLTHTKGKRAIYFGGLVKYSKQVAQAFRDAGVRAEHLDGEDHPKRRDHIIGQLRNGDIDVLCNADIVSEGFDAPDVDVVIIGAPTRSVTYFLQRCGRAMRPRDGKRAVILDLPGLSMHPRMGPPTLVREWSLEDGQVTQVPGLMLIAAQDALRDRKPMRMVKCSLQGLSVGPENILSTSNIAVSRRLNELGFQPASAYLMRFLILRSS